MSFGGFLFSCFSRYRVTPGVVNFHTDYYEAMKAMAAPLSDAGRLGRDVDTIRAILLIIISAYWYPLSSICYGFFTVFPGPS